MPASTLAAETRRILKAFGYAARGVRFAFAHEGAFRTECAAALVMIPLACLLHVGAPARAMLVGSVLLVLIVELLNTGLEKAVDRISPEYHELSGHAKDLGAAAVLLSLVNAGVIWLMLAL